MIDTVRLYASISDELYHEIEVKTDVIAKFNIGNNQVYYSITNGHLEGSYGSSLAYRLFTGKHGLTNVLELERFIS